MPSLLTQQRPDAEPSTVRADTVTFSLISHTNVGKTTLARTLLRRDVGDALDQPHVTDVAEAHTMIEDGGKRLLLWDTPGFGDTARLLKRLRSSGQPVRWMITQLWDRFRDRALWCSQQAVRNVQEEADAVLYLVNATERPGSSSMAYVGMEMEILEWIGKPVVLLLNQTGPPRAAIEEEVDEAEWRMHVSRYPVVKAVLGLDAFARCWVQEGQLLDALAPLLPSDKQELFSELRQAWRSKNLAMHQACVSAMAAQLTGNALDRVNVTKESFVQRFGFNRAVLHAEMDTARAALMERLTERSVRTMNEMIRLHGLDGDSAGVAGVFTGDGFGMPRQVDEPLWVAVGGVLSGAGAGVLADIKTGGMTLGGGAILGAFVGGAGAFLLARGYNLTRGSDHSVRWTEEHFAAQAEMALLCYLAVSHYGRGRGEWRDSVHPPEWKRAVYEVVQARRSEFDGLWKEAGAKEPDAGNLTGTANSLLASCAAALLRRLYPAAGTEWLGA